VVLAGALLVAACGAPAADQADPPVAPVVTAPATATPEASAVAAGDAPAALQFSAPLVGGGQFGPHMFVGKPVAFWFWAPT
jgi:hypothetical protein